MADVSTISVLLQAKDQVSATLERVERRMGGLAGAVRRHQRGLGIAATATGAAITGLAAIAVKGAMDQEIGIRGLDQALKNVGQSYAAQKTEIEKVIEAQQRKTNFGDEQQRDALQKLVAIGGKYEGSLQALVVAQDFAAGAGMDLQSAALLVGKAIAGETSTLSRYGIIMEEGATITDIMATLTAKFGGAAAAAANPMTQLKNRIGDLFEAIGMQLLPTMEGILKKSELFIRNIIAWTEAHPKLTATLVVLVAGIGALLAVVGPLLLILPGLILALKGIGIAFIFLNASMGPWGLALTALSIVIYAVIQSFSSWTEVLEFSKKVVATIIGVYLKFADVVLACIQAVGKFLGIEGVEKWAKDMRGHLDKVRGSVKAFGDEADKTREKIKKNNKEQEELQRQMARNFANRTDEMVEANNKFVDSIRKSNEEYRAAQSKRATDDIANDKFVLEIRASNRAWEREQENIAYEKLRAIGVATAEAEKERTDEARRLAEERISIRVNEINRMLDEARREEQGLDSSLDRLKENLDETIIAWRNSGSSMEDVIKQWASETGTSIDDVINEWDRLNIDTDDIKDVLQEFTKATGKDFLAWGGEVEEAAAVVTRSLDTIITKSAGVGQAVSNNLGTSLSAVEERRKEMGINQSDTQFAWNEVNKHFGLQTGAGALGVTQEGLAKQLAAQQTDARLKETFEMVVEEAADLREKREARAAEEASAQAKRDKILSDSYAAVASEKASKARAAFVDSFEGRMANGGMSRGGIQLVGERGPELVSLPSGSRVHPNGTGPGGGMTFHFHGAVYGVDDLQRVVVEAVRDHALSGGFEGVFA